MTVSAIVVTYRTGSVLRASIDAMRGAEGVDEVIIVDNGNTAEFEEFLDAAAAADSRVQILRGQGNVGFGAACNLGARQARSSVLIFINPDVILQSTAPRDLHAALEAAPPPAIVGGDLRDHHGRLERGCRRDELTPWRAFVSASGLWRLERISSLFRDFNRERDALPLGPAPVGAISGALFATRSSDYLSLGGFDEGYFLHFEDIDLCKRANDAGWRVLFAPGPHGQHVRSSSDVASSEVARHKFRGLARYLRKVAKGPVDGMFANVAAVILNLLASRR